MSSGLRIEEKLSCNISLILDIRELLSAIFLAMECNHPVGPVRIKVSGQI